jgi:Fic family protein
MTLELLAKRSLQVPVATTWLLSDLGEAKGKQELQHKKEPEHLRVLRRTAIIESAVSSNRIEGVVIDRDRIDQVVMGRGKLIDRDELEVRGYREALAWIHESHQKIPISVETICHLHYLSHGKAGDAGQLKTRDSNIIETYPDGRSRVRFKTVSAKQTPAYLDRFVGLWSDGVREQWAPHAILFAAANLDFLCIHPFRDGNGRVSRLLLLLAAYQSGLSVGRYVSLERLIEQNKDRYSETLEQSSIGWHEGKAEPWPYANYLLHILKSSYSELETRLEGIRSGRGAKTALIEGAIAAKGAPFSLVELEQECPGVSRDLIRRTLAVMRASGKVEPLGRGPGARWQLVPRKKR